VTAGAVEGGRSDREVRLIAIAAIVGMLMPFLDTSIVNVGLQTLSRELHAPLGTIQWVTTAYLLALAAVIPVSGWASERFGTRRVWVVSLIAFGGGSILCGLAWSSGSLIAFRALQGLGGGIILSVGMSIMAQAAGPGRFGRVTSLMAIPVLCGPVLGPLAGGAILTVASWRWMFFVNAPVLVIALTLAWKLLDGQPGRVDAGSLDWLGLGLLCPGLVAIVFGLSEVRAAGGLASRLALGPLLAGSVLVLLFVVHSARAPHPIIDVGLFRLRGFGAASISILLGGGAIFGTWLVLPLYFQLARGFSPLAAGALVVPQGVGVMICTPIAGRLTDRVGGGRVALVGLSLMTLSTLPLALEHGATPLWLTSALLFVRGIGFGSTLMPAMAAAYALLGHGQVPRATSALTTIQRVGGTLTTTLYAVVLQRELRGVGSAGGAAGEAGATVQLPAHVREQVFPQLSSAFAHTFWWIAGTSGLGMASAGWLAWTTRARPSAAPDERVVSPRAAP
jgi:EmrB/QacA subfamily drug resistance transporter